MSNKKRSSKRLTRVPLKFGDSINSIVNKNNRKANVDGSIEDIENDNGHGGSGAENGKGNGVNQEFIRDLMGDASKIQNLPESYPDEERIENRG
ncbi:hypothetical protein Tco_1442070 [Tanacetum coccineum]